LRNLIHERKVHQVSKMIEEMPQATEDRLGWQLVREISAGSAEILKPIFDVHGGRNGRLSIQTDPRLYRDARAIVVPSRWPENCPLVVLEAMASARAVIASRVGGIPELVRDGKEGLLVPQGDAALLRQAIVRLGDDRELAAGLGRAGRQRAEAHYAPGHHIDTIESIYERARIHRREAP